VLDGVRRVFGHGSTDHRRTGERPVQAVQGYCRAGGVGVRDRPDVEELAARCVPLQNHGDSSSLLVS